MTWRKLFASVCQFNQMLRSDLLDHGPWSVKFLVGAAAKITTQGADRDLPFRVGATPVVTDRGVLAQMPVGIERGNSWDEQVGRPLELIDQRVVN